MVEFNNNIRLYCEHDRVVHPMHGRGTVTKEQEKGAMVSVKFDHGTAYDVEAKSILRVWIGYCVFPNKVLTQWKIYEVVEWGRSNYAAMRPVDVMNDKGEKSTVFASRFVELFRGENNVVGTILNFKPDDGFFMESEQ